MALRGGQRRERQRMENLGAESASGSPLCSATARLRLRNRKFFHITNCLFYAQTEDQLAYTDIANCWAGHITGNMFHSPHPKNLQKEPPSKRICVAVDKQSKHISISGNIFNGKGVAIRVEPGATGIQTLNNQNINPHVVTK